MDASVFDGVNIKLTDQYGVVQYGSTFQIWRLRMGGLSFTQDAFSFPD
jgi:hypothetical protein